MEPFTRTHTNKGHRDTNEQAPTRHPRKTPHNLYVEERRRNCEKSVCLAREVPECELLPKRSNIDLHRRLFSRRQALILHLWESNKNGKVQRKATTLTHITASLASAPPSGASGRGGDARRRRAVGTVQHGVSAMMPAMSILARTRA